MSGEPELLAQFLQGQSDRALERIARMAQSYRSPPDLQKLILRLIERALIQEALLVWGWMSAFSLVPDRETESKLLAAARAGWETSHLRGMETHIYFREALHVSVRKIADLEMFECRVAECEFTGRGDSAAQSLEDTTKALRQRTNQLHQQMTHTLSEDDQRQKRLLLGRVDLVHSELIERDERTKWVVGQFKKNDRGELVFRTFGSQARDFLLKPGLKVAAQEIGITRFAKISTNSLGHPIGEVLEFK